MAHLSSTGALAHFLSELSANDEIDAETKAVFAEVAQDRSFLTALDEYVDRTRVFH
jgi:hypothetical protein